ncbi:MAG: hypothetical protein ACOCVG_04365, partial [Verrucomicrobiota bacterium]
PTSLGKPDFDEGHLPVALTKQQIEESPPLQADAPISLQHEMHLARHFGWPAYWDAAAFTGGVGFYASPTSPQTHTNLKEQDEVPNIGQLERAGSALRSCQELGGYDILAADGEIGHIKDAYICLNDWAVHYLFATTRDWLPGKKVVIAADWITEISFTEQRVRLGHTRNEIKEAPHLDGGEPIDDDFEERLTEHFSLPPYWQKSAATSH